MGTTMNKQAYARLVEENLEWLLKQPRGLERDHIEAMLRTELREFAIYDRSVARELTERAGRQSRRRSRRL
jgi:hypothetical protein